MTAQLLDVLVYQEKEWYIVDSYGSSYFTPQDHGLTPVCFSSACYRGHYSAYEIVVKKLILQDVSLALSNHEMLRAKNFGALTLFNKPPINNISDGLLHYKDLNTEIEFTGGLLVARNYKCIDEIDVFWSQMIDLPSYMDVHDLAFEAGELTQDNDASKDVLAMREWEISAHQNWNHQAPFPEREPPAWHVKYLSSREERE